MLRLILLQKSLREEHIYQETGTPELARLLCESDNEFWPQRCPDFEFHRGDSWENTIAYGREQCDFIFEQKR